MISRSQLQELFLQSYYEASDANDLANLTERRLDKILELIEQIRAEAYSKGLADGYRACTKEYQND